MLVSAPLALSVSRGTPRGVSFASLTVAVSVAAVGRSIRVDSGHCIEDVCPSADPIDEARLREALLREDAPWTGLRVVEEAGSTNVDLVAQARCGAPSGSVLIANFQSAGRGRQGRSLVCASRHWVAVSVLLHPLDVAPARWGWLPLLSGLGVAEGLFAVSGCPGVAEMAQRRADR